MSSGGQALPSKLAYKPKFEIGCGIVIEFNGFEPGFDVFAGFGKLPQV
jgi:hypothetical protein